ncbi:MAG: tripartite tricarboxylate transporter TctB family protein [Candidatus Accumulibacter sp.]|jgi:hypothetical protein|nr:tripartite tricarboxylate transporter TctB family protein [Accumulibacter sp.]
MMKPKPSNANALEPHCKRRILRIKSQRDLWSGVLFIVLGTGFAWGALDYSFGNAAMPGPGYFPFGLGLILAFLGLLILLKSLAAEVDTGDPIGDIAWRPLLTIVASLVIFGVSLSILGLFLALPLLVFISAMASEEFRWREAAVNAFFLTFGSWVIFVRGLDLLIPLKPWFMGP